MRWLTIVAGDDDLAAVEQALVRLLGPSCMQTFVPCSGKRRISSGERPARVGGRRQRVVVDEDELGGVGACRAVLGDDHRDDLSGVADDLAGDERAAHARVDEGDRRRRDTGRGRCPRR